MTVPKTVFSLHDQEYIRLKTLLCNFGLPEDDIQNKFFKAIAVLEKHGLIRDKQHVLNLFESRSQDEVHTLYNTVLMAAEIVEIKFKWGTLFKEDHYEKKIVMKDEAQLKTSQKYCYSYVITKNKELIISFDQLGFGAVKKVSKAFNLSTGDELVKVAVRGDFNISQTRNELGIQRNLATDNEDIFNPEEVCSIQRASVKSDKHEKLVFYVKRMAGSAAVLITPEVKSRQILMATFCLLRGLEKMHQNEYVHMDIHIGNLLIEDLKTGVLKIADFGTTKKNGEAIGLVQRQFLPPECGTKAIAANDDYMAGLAIMMLIIKLSLVSSDKDSNVWINRDCPFFCVNDFNHASKPNLSP